MFSKSSEYAIRSTLFIALQSMKDKKVGLKNIADAIASPEAFTAKILQQLTKIKIVDSSKGPNGGYFISNKNLDRKTLIDVITAIDGVAIFNSCVLGLKDCGPNKPCSVHDKFTETRNQLKRTLERSNLRSLAEDLDQGKAFLKI